MDYRVSWRDNGLVIGVWVINKKGQLEKKRVMEPYYFYDCRLGHLIRWIR